MSKTKAGRHAPEEIDAHLETLPDDIRSTLERVREIIRESAPQCTERVSYGIPIFRVQKDLVGISSQKQHCSLHTMSPALVETMREELKGTRVSGATIHFTPDKPLRREFIENIVRARIAELAST